MACDSPYKNPAGLKFVTRVQYEAGDALYLNALTSQAPILNIPNGAGPGTLLLGTHDTYAVWTVRDAKNLVRETQRAYTGAASWAQLWVEDGCTVNVLLLDRDSVSHYDEDGIERLGNPESRIFAQWLPSGSEITTFDRLSLCSGPLGTANPYPFRTLGGNPSPPFVPPGLCRFLSISSDVPISATIRNITGATNVLYETIPATTNFQRAVPAWGVVDVITTQGATDFCVSWNRYPMVGA